MQRNNRPLFIGITGNIGSGKSSFCNLLVKSGIRVYETDKMAKTHLHDPDVLHALSTHFGPLVLSRSTPGTVDNKALAKMVFGQPAELGFLNSLLHPLVLQDMQALADKSTDDFLIFEVPLLFETGLQDCFDYLVLVTCSEDIRLNRLMARGDKDAEQRAEYQISDQEKIAQVDRVVDNNGGVELLAQQAARFITDIPHLQPKKPRPFFLI